MSNYGSVTITDVATKILDTNDVYRPVFLQIIGNQTVYLGDNNSVTTANGFPVVKNTAAIEGQLAPGQALWGICAVGQTEDLRFFSHVD